MDQLIERDFSGVSAAKYGAHINRRLDRFSCAGVRWISGLFSTTDSQLSCPSPGHASCSPGHATRSQCASVIIRGQPSPGSLFKSWAELIWRGNNRQDS